MRQQMVAVSSWQGVLVARVGQDFALPLATGQLLETSDWPARGIICIAHHWSQAGNGTGMGFKYF